MTVARKKKETTSTSLEPLGFDERGKMTTLGVVDVVTVSALPFVTVGPNHKVWGAAGVLAGSELLSMRGFVKVSPPPEVTEEVLWRVVADVRAHAVAVRVLPVPRIAAVTSSGEKVQVESTKNVRQVVDEMVGEANTQDREALDALVQSVMSKVGL